MISSQATKVNLNKTQKSRNYADLFFDQNAINNRLNKIQKRKKIEYLFNQ